MQGHPALQQLPYGRGKNEPALLQVGPHAQSLGMWKRQLQQQQQQQGCHYLHHHRQRVKKKSQGHCSPQLCM